MLPGGSSYRGDGSENGLAHPCPLGARHHRTGSSNWIERRKSVYIAGMNWRLALCATFFALGLVLHVDAVVALLIGAVHFFGQKDRDFANGWATLISGVFQVVAVGWAAFMAYKAQRIQIDMAERHERERRAAPIIALAAGLKTELLIIEGGLRNLSTSLAKFQEIAGYLDEFGRPEDAFKVMPQYAYSADQFKNNQQSLGILGAYVADAVVHAHKAVADLPVNIDPPISKLARMICDWRYDCSRALKLVRDACDLLRAVEQTGSIDEPTLMMFMVRKRMVWEPAVAPNA